MIFRAYLADQSIDHLATTLRKGGIKDLVTFFPPSKREDKALEEHFRGAGLPQVAEWWTKRQNAALKETVVSTLKDLLSNEEGHAEVCYIPKVGCRILLKLVSQIVAALKSKQAESPLPEAELVGCIWQGLVSSIDWSARQDQNEALAIREIGVRPSVLDVQDSL